LGRRSHIAIAITLLFVGLLATGFMLLYTLDFNAFKGVISNAVHDATGRELSIAGDVRLSRSLPPTLSISDVTFANASWGTKSPMVSVDRLQVQVALLPLLRRQLVFERLNLSGTTMSLETDAKGRGNWELQTASDPGSGNRSIRSVQLRLIHINGLHITYSNGKSGWETQLELASLAVERLSAGKQFNVDLNGAWRGKPVVLSGSVGMLGDVRAGTPFPIDLSGQVAGDKIALTGNIADLFNLSGLDLKLAAGGTNLAHLGTAVGVRLPKTESFGVTARLQGGRQILQVTELQGTTRSNGVTFDVSGMIGNLTTLGDVALQLQVSGNDLSLVGPLIDITLSETGPFSATGRLTGSGEALAFQDATVKLSRGGMYIRLTGDINDVIGGRRVDLSLETAGPNLAEFGDLIRNSLPDTGAFRITGRLRGSFGNLSLVDAHGKLDWGGVSLTASGAVAGLEAMNGIDLKAAATGASMDQVGRLIGQSWPKTGPFELSGRLTGRKDVLALRGARALVSHGELTLSATGTVDNLTALKGVSLEVTVSGKEFAELSPLIAMKFSKLGAFKVTGKLTGSAAELVLGNATAMIGRSDLSGTVRVTLDDRPKFTVRLDSGLIDYTPFMTNVKDEEKRLEDTAHGTGGVPLFSDESLGLDAFGKFDVDVVLHMRRIHAREAEFEFGRLVLSLINGELKISDLTAIYKGARISGHAKLDPESPPRLETDFLVQGFDLGRFLAETQVTSEVEGLVDIAVDVNSQGDSMQALAANLDGSVGLVMGKGRASRYLDLLAAGLSRQVLTFWGHHKWASRVECGVTLFDIDHGVATSQAFVLVTKAGIIKAEGQINIAAGQINFLLKPKPRRPTLVSLATDLRVTGSVTAPKVQPDTRALAEKGVKLISTLAIGPLGVLAPFANLGAWDGHPCDIRAIDDKLLTTPALRKDASETGLPR